MNNPLVSVALCTYNGAAYLAQQLDTLVNQTYQNLEIVVVDDCSTDNTFEILKAYASKYQQFKIHRNENNLGFVANFERATKLCAGELIALCDQDDLWHPEKIALQVEGIKDNLFIYHDSEFINEDGSSMHKKISDLMNLYRGGKPEVFLFFNCVSGHEILMKRELLDDALPLKAHYFHDWWLAYVATNIGKIDYIDRCLVQYRQHAHSDTNILGLARKADNYNFSSVHQIERMHQWLGYCAGFPKNKHPRLIKKIYAAYTNRLNTFTSFDLVKLLYKYRKTIFYIRKKSNLSKLNYIYKQVWGAKAKKMFGK